MRATVPTCWCGVSELWLAVSRCSTYSIKAHCLHYGCRDNAYCYYRVQWSRHYLTQAYWTRFTLSTPFSPCIHKTLSFITICSPPRVTSLLAQNIHGSVVRVLVDGLCKLNSGFWKSEIVNHKKKLKSIQKYHNK